MAATVAWFFDFGGSDGTPGTQQDVSALGPPRMRFKTNDDATIDNVDPVPIISGQTKRSYWKHVYLRVTGGTFTQIDNVKFYTDGTSWGTGISAYIGDENLTNNQGSQAGYEVGDGTPGDTGVEMVTGHTGITARTDTTTYTSGAVRDITISEPGAILDASGDRTNYVVIQLEVLDTASPGNLDDRTWTFRYDEI